MSDRTVTDRIDRDEDYTLVGRLLTVANAAGSASAAILRAFAADLVEHPEVVEAFRERQRVRDTPPSDVDRLAQLLCDAHSTPPPWEQRDDGARRYFYALARRAIDAGWTPPKDES